MNISTRDKEKKCWMCSTTLQRNPHQDKTIKHISLSASAIYSIIGVTGEQRAKRENETIAIIVKQP